MPPDRPALPRRGGGAGVPGLLTGVMIAVLLAGCGGTALAPATATVTRTVTASGGSGAGSATSTDKASTGATGSGTSSASPGAGGPVIDGTKNDLTIFATPSTNIVCAAAAQSGGWGVRCDVNVQNWQLPPKPDSCEFDWGHGTYLEDGKAGLTCVSDALAGSDLVGSDGTWWNGQPGSQVVTAERGQVVSLAYGATMTFGTISCLSQTDGLHCTDSASTAGFDISREGYRLR